VNSFSHEGF